MIHSYDDTKAMADILRKLQEATDKSAERLIEESKANDNLKMALETTKTDSGVKIKNFEIIPTALKVGNISKNYYDIVSESGDTLYKELSLFESAMSIVKRLMLNKKLAECDRIAKLDQDYDTHLIEAYDYKARARMVTESFKIDVYEAKMTAAMSKAKEIKTRILSTL